MGLKVRKVITWYLGRTRRGVMPMTLGEVWVHSLNSVKQGHREGVRSEPSAGVAWYGTGDACLLSMLAGMTKLQFLK